MYEAIKHSWKKHYIIFILNDKIKMNLTEYMYCDKINCTNHKIKKLS